MAIDVDELFNGDAFKGLSLEEKLSFKTLVKNLEGRNTFEAMNYIMGYMRKMPKRAPLSPAEQGAMLAAISESLPDNDAKKFKDILNMIQSMNSRPDGSARG